jgi:para-nitrobenzyl esterase
MAQTASAYWVRFATTGNPNGGGATPWAPYDAVNEPLLDFTSQGPAGRRNFESGKMAFLQHMRLQWFHDNDIPTQ